MFFSDHLVLYMGCIIYCVEELMKLIQVLVVLFSLSFAGFAMELGIEEAKEMTLRNSQMIKAYREQLKAITYQKYQADGAYLPKITLTQSYMNTNEPANAAFAKMAQGRFDMVYFGTQLPDPDRVDNFETKITIVQPIFMNGKIFFGRKQAVEMRKASSYEVERTIQYVLFNLHRAFYGLSLSEKGLVVSKRSLERTQKYYDAAKEFQKNGMLVKSDLLVAETHLLMNEEAVKDMEKQYNVAKSQLQRIINSDEDVQIVWNENPHVSLNSLDTYLNTAIQYRQDLKAMQSMLAISELEVKKSKSAFAPEVFLFADYKQNDETIFGDAGSGTTVGAQLNWNLFNGFSDRNKVMENRSKQLSMLHKIADYKLKIKVDVKEAYFSTDAAVKKLEAAEKRAEAAREALKITERRFNEGIIKVTELLDREVEMKQVELAVYMAEYEVMISQIALAFATGQLK